MILLSALLLAIIITGIFITLQNKGNNSKKNEYANENETFQQNNEKEKKEPEEFYYIEEFIDEPYGKEMAMINYLNIMEK